MQTVRPILITGADRSGSSLVARVLNMCGVFGGEVSNMYENTEIKTFHHYFINRNTQEPFMPDTDTKWPNAVDWAMVVYTTMQLQGLVVDKPFFYKDAGICQSWPMWQKAFPAARWLIVRRRTADIVNSCIHTAYMKRFKSAVNLKQIKVTTEQEGWLWWVREYEARFVEIANAGINYEVIWPERMADGDYEQMKQLVQSLGLQWNPIVEEVITPLFKNRKEHGKESNN